MYRKHRKKKNGIRKVYKKAKGFYKKVKPVAKSIYRGGVTTAKVVARDIRDVRRAGSLPKKKRKKKFISAEEFNRRLLGI